MMNLAQVPVAILAGGLATRLLPITAEIPKILVQVAGRPFIYHQIELLKREGIQKIVLCLGHLGEMVVDEIGDGTQLGVSICTSFDGETQIGTGGALLRALPLLGDEFFVLYGDAYLPIRYAPVLQFFRQSNREGLMTVYRNKGQFDKSNVEFEKGRVVVYDKNTTTIDMEYIDYGLGIFRKEAFDSFRHNDRFDLSLVHKKLISEDQLSGFEVEKRFYEIGSHSGLVELDLLLNGN